MAGTSATSTDLLAVSAGLNLVSGVFGYLSSLEAADIASSRADMIRMESDANAQRYSERASAERAQQKMAFIGAGVRVSGSVIDTLDNSARVALENIRAIRRNGAVDALDQQQAGEGALVQGRNALLGGLTGGITQAAAIGSIYGRGATSTKGSGAGESDPKDGK